MLESSTNVIFALFGGYLVTSYLLFKHPSILYRKKKIKFISRHISHRGGAGEAYENTINAFKRSLAVGTDMLELDCQITKDKQVVVCHDNNLMRSTGVDKNVSDLDYEELPLLKPSLPIEFDPGETFTGSEHPDDRKIPLLNDVFRHFPRTPMNIDVKVDNDILISEISRLITSYRREDITVWGSIYTTVSNKCFLTNPEVNLFFPFIKVLHLLTLFYCGLLPFFPVRETHLEIFPPSMYLQSSWKLCKNKDSHFMLLCPAFLLRSLDRIVMNKHLFRHLSRRGIQTYVWVINDETQFKPIYDMGATGIMTDYPTKLRKFLDENPQYCASEVQLISTD